MSITDFTARKLANVDRAVVDQRLSPLDFRLLWLLSSAADSKSGIARRKQADLARKLGIHPRTVQRCRDHLVALGYLKPLGHKPGYVSAYNIPASKKAALVPPVEEVGGAGAAFDEDHAALVPPAGGARVPNRRHVNRTNTSLSSPEGNLPLSQSGETETCGPRQREDALGPLGAELRKRIDPATFEAWFIRGEVEVVSQVDNTVTLAVRSNFFAQQIQNRFESDILTCSGALRVKLEVTANNETVT